MKTILVTILSMWILHSSWAQMSAVKLSESQNGKAFNQLLESISQQSELTVFYNPDETQSLSCNGIIEGDYFMSWVRAFLSPFPLSVVKLDKNTAAIVNSSLITEFGGKPYNYKSFPGSGSKANYTLSGRIVDQNSGESIPGVQVILPISGTGTISNFNGEYEITVPKGINKIDFRYLGYKPLSYALCVRGSGQLNLSMEESYEQLDELVITAESEDSHIKSHVAGVETMTMETMKSIPTFMGEVDPIKSISALPGVSTGELSSGFNVRGGDTGQNLILMDEGIIFNPSHMFGFFSAFNPDLVKNVELYKGGGPANYGGRISSTLDISLINGNLNEFGIQGMLGATSSRLTTNVPMIKGKSSLALGGRVAYPNWLIKSSNDLDIKYNRSSFHDVTARYYHRVNDKNVVSFSAYYSYDDFLFASDSIYNEWGTLNLSTSWTHNVSQKSSLKLSLSNSKYFSLIEDQDVSGKFSARTGHNITRLKVDVNHDWHDNLNAVFGSEITFYNTNPGVLKSKAVTEKIEHHYSTEASLFFNVAHNMGRFGLMAGLRSTIFSRIGPASIFSFDSGQLSDSTTFGSAELVKNYYSLEPRLSCRYTLSESSSLKASFYRTSQFVHLISNTLTAVPQNYWIASGPSVKPQYGNQISLGYFYQVGGLRMSLEPYWKQVTNSLDYRDGLDITQNRYLEAGLIQGRGKSYGLELLLEKVNGNLTGWIAYTYSRSLRRFNFPDLGTIKTGQFYPSSVDIPHNISLVSTYQFSDRVSGSLNFSFKSGSPITIPIANYSSNGILSVLTYSDRNDYRAPDYHRLDLSVTVKDRDLENKRIDGEWNFSIYNLYARKNAYSVYFDEYGRARKLYIIGGIFPSISYSFKI